MKAHALKRNDQERDIHLQAFVNQSVQATKKQGKKTVPKFEKFSDFYNHKQKEKDILYPNKKKEESKKVVKISQLMTQANNL